MARRHLWKELNELKETELRTQIILPLLQHTTGIYGITDVHGKNEAGLDIIFFTQDAVRQTCFGLQLKRGPIGGGAGRAGVEEILTQLRLARKMKHPVAVGRKGEHRIDRFIVATSGNITENARKEIAGSIEESAVDFWDGHEIMRRINTHLPELLTGIAASTIEYLRAVVDTYDRLDALDQIQPMHKRTLTDIYEEPELARKYASPVVDDSHASERSSIVPPEKQKPNESKQINFAAKPKVVRGRISGLSLLRTSSRSVLIADQNDGKTSLLRILAIRRAKTLLAGAVPDSEDTLPIILRAREILKAASVRGAMTLEFTRMKAVFLAAEIEEDLKSGLAVVLIDGFSELQSEHDKERCEAIITAFEDAFPLVKSVIAGRPADFLEPKYFVNHDHYSIVVFSEKQVASLARKWTSEITNKKDVTKAMISRVRDALQLPGSPIPAIIGVMLFEEEQKYVTNTADAVDAYMTIRLGRYAREMGIKQEVEWSRKQDLLAEVAFAMVDSGIEGLAWRKVESEFNGIFDRLGEVRRGESALRELVDSGVLVQHDDQLRFHRTAFRDFFAAQYLFRRKSAELDSFLEAHHWDKKWGPVLVFAAGLRRHNTDLLRKLNKIVSDRRKAEVGPPSSEFLYGSYLLGRILSNSEASDEDSRLPVLRTCLGACSASIPEFVAAVKKDMGNIGELAALIGVEQTFLVTVGVPWLALQFRTLALDATLSEEERYLAASVYATLGGEDCTRLIELASKTWKSPRVLLVLYALVRRLSKEHDLKEDERVVLKRVERTVDRALKGREREVRHLLQFKSKFLELAAAQLKRLET